MSSIRSTQRHAPLAASSTIARGASSLVRALAAGAIVAGASAAMAGPTNVPFKASVDINENVAFLFVPPCFAIGTLTGSGTATHLGKIKGAALDCINPTAPISFNSPMSYAYSSTKVVFTADNGDMLYLAYAGTLTAQASGPHVIAGHFVITGGTSRFVGASGGGTMSGSEDLSSLGSGTGKASFDGTITY